MTLTFVVGTDAIGASTFAAAFEFEDDADLSLGDILAVELDATCLAHEACTHEVATAGDSRPETAAVPAAFAKRDLKPGVRSIAGAVCVVGGRDHLAALWPAAPCTAGRPLR